MEVKRRLPPTAERPLRCLCTFHQNQKIVAPDLTNVPPRAQALAQLWNNPSCHFVGGRLPSRECWELHGRFAFQISPHGIGLDYFRTWESLALGTIPIVKASTLDPLYADNGLPVVRVRSWSEITPENLERWQAECLPLLVGLDHRLTAEAWTEKVRAAGRAVGARP